MSFSRATFENLHSKLISNKAPDIEVLDQLAVMNFSSNKNECKLVLESLEKLANIDSVDPKLRSSIINCFENCVKYLKFTPAILAMLPFIYHGLYSKNEALRKQAIQILKSVVSNERYDSTEDLRKEIFKICKVYMPRMVMTHDSKYLGTFELTLELLGKRLNIDIPILNGMLKLEQDALLSRDGAFQIQALIAWKKVIDTFSLYHQVFENPKRIALVMKPLLRSGGDNLGVINAKIDVWLHLLSKFNLEILCFESTVLGMCNYIVSLGHFPGLKNRFVSIFTKMICGSDQSVPVISDDLFIKNYPKMFSYFKVSVKEDVDRDLKEKIICSFIKRLVTVGGPKELDYTMKSNELQKSEIKDICFTLGRDAQFRDFVKKNPGNHFLQKLLEYFLDVLIDMDTIAKWNELVDFAMISVQCNNKPYSVIQWLLQKIQSFPCSSPKSDLWMLIAKIAINYATCTESCNQGREFDPSFEVMKEILIEPFMICHKSNKEDINGLLLKKSALRDLWNQLYRLAISTIDLEVVASSESFRKHLFNDVLKDSAEDNSLYGSFLLSTLEFAYSEVSCVKPSKEELMILYKLLSRAASCDLDKDDCNTFLTFMKSLMKIFSRDITYPELVGNCVKELNKAGHEGTLNAAKRKKILKNNEAVLTDDEEELKKWKNIEEKMKGHKALEPFTNPKSAKKSTVTPAGKASEMVKNTSASTAAASSSSKTPVKYSKEKDKASQELTIQRSSKKQVNKGPSPKIEESPFRSSKELNQAPKETIDVSSKGNHVQTVGKNLSAIEDKSDITTRRNHSSKTPIKSSKKKDKAPRETDGVTSEGDHIQIVGKNLPDREDNNVSAPRTLSSKTPLKSSKKKDEAPKETNDVSSKGNHVQTVGKNMSESEDKSDVTTPGTHSSKTLIKPSKKNNESLKEIKDASSQEKIIQPVGKNISENEDDADVKKPQTQFSKTPIRSSKKKDESPKEIQDASSQRENIQAVGKNVSEIEGDADIKMLQTPSSKTPIRSSKKKDEEFVVIPSTPRSRVLTERQKEKLKEQKRDIPAMYNDYSQDSMLIATNSSQSQSLLSECKSVTNSLAFPKIETSENKSTQKSTTKNGVNSNDRRQSKRRKIEFPVEQLVVEENAVSSPFKVDFKSNAPSDQLSAFNLNDAKCVRFESPSGQKVALATDDDEFVPRKRKFVPTPFKKTPANGSKFEDSKNVSLQDEDEIHNLSALFKSPIRNSPTIQADQKKIDDLNDSNAVMQKKKGKIVCLEIEGKENSIFKEPLVDQQSSIVSMENEEKHALDPPSELGGKYSENGKRSKKRHRKSELPLRSLRSAAISSPNSPTSPDLLTTTITKIKPVVVLSSSKRGRPKNYIDTPRPVIVSTKILGGISSAKDKTIKENDPAKSMVSNISKEGLPLKMEELKNDNIAETTSQKTTKVVHDSPELNLNQFPKPSGYDSVDELISKDKNKIKKKYSKTTKTKKKSPTLENCVEVNKVRYLEVPKSPNEQSECELKILKPIFSVNMMGEATSERDGDEEKVQGLDGSSASKPRPPSCEKSQSDNNSPVRSVKRNHEIITMDEFENTTRDVSEVCEEKILCPEVLSNASLPSPTECATVLEHRELSFVSDCESESSLPLSVLQLRCRRRKENKALLKCNDKSNEHENIHSCSSKIYSDEDLPICSVTDVKSLSSAVALDISELPTLGAISVVESAEKSGCSVDSSEGQETLVPSKVDDPYALNGESVSYSVMSVFDSKKIRVMESRFEEDRNIELQQGTECGGAPESVDLFSEPSLRVSPRRTPRKSPSKPYDKDIADTVKCSLKFEGSPQKSLGPSLSSEKKAEKITATHLTPYKQSKLGRMPSLSGRSAQLVVLAQAKGKQMEKEIQDAKKLSPSIPEQPEVQNIGGDSKPQSPAKPWKRHSYSPNASPSSSILKRKLSDEDNTTPPFKSRKVTFRTPEVSDQVQVPRKEEEKDSYPRLRRRSLGKQLSVATDEEPILISLEKPSLAATAEQLEETLPVQVASSLPSESVASSSSNWPTTQDEIIFPELMDCNDEVGRLTCVLASGPWVKMLNRKLKERNIATVGQLCSLPPSEIEKLDIQPPKIPKAKSAMQKFYLEWKKGVDKQEPNLAKPKLVDSHVEAKESSVAAIPLLPVEINEDTVTSQDNSETNAKSIAGNVQNYLATHTVLSAATTTELNEEKAELISVSTQTDNTDTIDNEYFLLDDEAKAALRDVISHMRKLMEKSSSS